MLRRTITVMATTLAVLAAGTIPVPAQTTGKDVAEKAADAGAAIKDYSIEKKDEAVAHAKKITMDVDARIKKLEVDASKQSDAVKAKLQAQLKELKAKRAKASQEANKLGKATAASWEDAKKGFATAYGDLASHFDKAVDDLKK